MTTIGTPTMTAAEEAAWAASQRKGTPWRGHDARKGASYAFKARPVAAQDARTPCLAGEAHRYRIPEPDGRHTLPGTCAKCGTEREFVTAGDTDWFHEESRQGKGRNGGRG